MLKCDEIYRNIQKYTGIYRNIQEYTEIYRNIQEYTEIYRNIQKYTRIYRNIQDHVLYGPVKTVIRQDWRQVTNVIMTGDLQR